MIYMWGPFYTPPNLSDNGDYLIRVHQLQLFLASIIFGKYALSTQLLALFVFRALEADGLNCYWWYG